MSKDKKSLPLPTESNDSFSGDIFALLRAVEPKDDTHSVRRTEFFKTNKDGKRQKFVKYTEIGAKGKALNEQTFPENNSLEYAKAKLNEAESTTVKAESSDDVMLKLFEENVILSESNKPENVPDSTEKPSEIISEPNEEASTPTIRTIDFYRKADEAESKKEQKRQFELDKIFKRVLYVLVPIVLILFVMFIGERYIKREYENKLRVISIETVPVSDTASDSTAINGDDGNSTVQGEETTTQSGFPININTADIPELVLLPGIGEKKAKSIIDYRESHGEFRSIEDIKHVSGIGKATFEKLKPFITTK